MISIVVCSVDEKQFQQFAENVKLTIGVQHEIIRVDNSGNKFGICGAYNYGADQAIYPFVCFSHEDIIFHTQNWGENVIEKFQTNSNLGVIGIAGSTYKSYAPSGWGIIPELRYVNLIQHYKSLPFETTHDCQNPENTKSSKVVCVDGVWMCTTKEVLNKYKFDEVTFPAFHCYDLDFCMQVSVQYEVAVVFDVLFEHLSEGKNDRAWVVNTLRFHRKWQKRLPVNISKISNKIIKQHEYNALYYFMMTMIENKFKIHEILTMLSGNIQNKSITKRQLIVLCKVALKDFINRKLKGIGALKSI